MSSIPGSPRKMNPGKVLERLRSEGTWADAASAEREARRGDLTKRLAAKQAEKDRYVKLYAQGFVDDDELEMHLSDLKNQVDNLNLLIVSVEDDSAGLTETRKVAESAESWLLMLKERVEEVEADTPEAFLKRRELVKLLVEQITTSRDEDGRPRVEIVYRFGPQSEEPGDLFVPSVLNSGPMEAAKILLSALSPPASGTRKFGWA